MQSLVSYHLSQESRCTVLGQVLLTIFLETFISQQA